MIKHLTFPQLVDQCASTIMQQLIRGHFRTGVYEALALAIDWSKLQDSK